MIVPMIKYSFLVYHRDFNSFLSKLQELGVVDISKENRTVDEEEKAIINQINRYTNALRFFETRTPSEEKITLSMDADDVISRLDILQKEREQFDNSIKKSQKELAEVKPWGNFDQSLIHKLSDKGIKIRYFAIPEKSFNDEWLQEYPIEIISTESGLVFFVLIDSGDIQIPADFQEVRQPQFSCKFKEDEINRYLGKIDEIEKEIDFLASYNQVIKKSQTELINSLEFKVVSSSADKQAGESVMVLQGWVPEPQNQDLVNFLEQESVIYISEKALPQDNAPILLKNNRFAKLFEPITRLFSFPMYAELDLTPFFAPFYMLFFGFCFGDAGYGILFVVVATIYKFKASQTVKPILSLVQFLGIAAVIFGALTGTVFGYDLAETQIPALVQYKSFFLDKNTMFYSSMAIGFVQIIFGMCVKAANQWIQFGWKYSVSTIGWVIFLLSSAIFAVLGKVRPELGLTAFGPIHLVIVGIAGLAIMFYNSPGKNPFMNFGTGIWDSYNMATGLLGDILSYIRLFALGLSGGILGGVFNSLAFGMAPDLPVAKQIVIVLILLIGHGINIFMSALGSLVHPVRLTFVEFYKNAGFVGGGKEYEPFQRKQ